ncbi:MAG: gamma-glutamyltransferase [Gammaproteobacteria bacterium]
MKNIRLLILLILFQPIIAFSALQGMVVSEQELASNVGENILRSGGNAIDAAVAVGYALAVVNPCCGNLGGGGFMTVHLADGKDVFLNFRETAPFAATTKMYLDTKGHIIQGKSTYGYLAVATPGTVMGLDFALKKFGSMTRQQVISPAIKLAEQGYILTSGDVKLLDANIQNFKKQANVASIFMNHGKPYQVGDRLIQNDLAASLKLISSQGTSIFYQGKIADEIVKASQANGGILSLKDFSQYRVEEAVPIRCTYRGYTIISAAPPSSGGVTLCEMLNILEKYPLKQLGFHSAESVHYIVEAMRYAFADRNNQLGDPDFVSNPVKKLISKDYAAEIRKKIQSNHASNSTIQNIPTAEGVNTTHYSVIDKMGNAVSVTYTLNSLFGAQVIADHTGFFLNNEMDDFTSKPGYKNQFGLVQGIKNIIQPGKRPLSSMTPTIITKNNKVVMIVGSPGGSRIITSTLLTILNVIDYGMNIQKAVDAPRFHHQWLPDVIEIEPTAFSKSTMQKLLAMGYHFKSPGTWGAVEAIYVDSETKHVYRGSDKRRFAGRILPPLS